MKSFKCKVTVSCKPRGEAEGDGDDEDYDDGIECPGDESYHFTITDSLEGDMTEDSRDALRDYAQARALDAFHYGNAIEDLDAVEISCEAEVTEE